MPNDSLEIDFAGQRLLLLADHALYWPDQRTLILADVHLGKDASFRAAGLPVPAGHSAKDLSRIERLVKATDATRLIVLGDLIHNRSSHHDELSADVSAFRELHP